MNFPATLPTLPAQRGGNGAEQAGQAGAQFLNPCLGFINTQKHKAMKYDFFTCHVLALLLLSSKVPFTLFSNVVTAMRN